MNTKVAVVTGAAGGLGRAISQKLMDSGFGVVGLDIDVTGLDETTNELGTGFVPKTTDLTDAGRVKQVLKKSDRTTGE
jgi:NADP-dependent 3-hydroxy acid dehydrogenase YdfG